MTLRNLFIINTVLPLVFGVALVLAPASLVSLYGGTLGEFGIVTGRLLGGAFLGYAVLSWFARNAEDSEVQRAIVLALFITNAIGFIVSLLARISGVGNPLSWSNVVLYLLLALGFGYFQFVKPAAS